MPSALLPIVALIRRELVSSLRHWPFYVLLTLCVLAAAALTVVVYPSFTESPGGGLSPQILLLTSRRLFTVISYVLAIGAIVVVPATSGSAIVSEREEETLDLLAMTSARPWHVVAAKMVNSIGHFLLLLIGLMPVAASAFFLVGLDTDMLWRVFTVIASTALACAAAGVLCSCLFRRPSMAVGFSYLSMLTLIGLPLLLVAVLLELFDVVGFDRSLLIVGVYAAPIISFLVNLNDVTGAKSSAATCGLVFTLLAVLMVAASNLLVARQWGQSAPVLRSSPRWRREAPASMPRKGQCRSFATWRNPLYLKEIWFEMSARRGFGLMVVLLPFGLAFSATTLIVLIRFTSSDSNSFTDAFLGWQILQAVLLPGLLIAATGDLFTKEHERSTFDGLRTTLLSPIAIVTAKLKASLRAAGLVFLSAMVGSAPLLLVPAISKLAILLGLVLLASCLLMAWGISSLASATHRKMTWAYVSAYVAMAMALIGNQLLGEFLLLYFYGLSMQSMDYEALEVFLSPISAFLIHAKAGGDGVYVIYYQDTMLGLLSLVYAGIVTIVTVGLCYAVSVIRYAGVGWKGLWRRWTRPVTSAGLGTNPTCHTRPVI